MIAIQASSYLIVGLWPVLHFASFSSVAGPKPDRYQFFVTDLLVLAIAIALLIGSLPLRRPDPVARGSYALAVATPVAFILVELRYLETLLPVYRADLALEVAFLVLLMWLGLKSRLPSKGAHASDGQLRAPPERPTG